MLPTVLAPSICAALCRVVETPVKMGIMKPGMPELATNTAFRVGRFWRGLGEGRPHGQ